MQQTQNEYRSHSEAMWQEAQTALQEGNAIQASEKLWGAAAQAVKAVAEARGWPHNNHRELYRVIGRLREETNEARVTELFAIANALHMNFYEWWMSLEDVGELSTRVQELREAMFRSLEAPSG